MNSCNLLKPILIFVLNILFYFTLMEYLFKILFCSVLHQNSTFCQLFYQPHGSVSIRESARVYLRPVPTAVHHLSGASVADICGKCSSNCFGCSAHSQNNNDAQLRKLQIILISPTSTTINNDAQEMILQ